MSGYFEICIPGRRGRTTVYGRPTLEEAVEFARDAVRKGGTAWGSGT